jgi:hypothetical protein
MSNLIFIVTGTGLNVQYWMEDEVVLMIAVALTKPSLSGLHAVDFINRSSSKLLGQKGGIRCIAFAPGYEIMAQQPHLGDWAIAEINFKKMGGLRCHYSSPMPLILTPVPKE